MELVPDRRIVQAWRSDAWPAGVYSIRAVDITVRRSDSYDDRSQPSLWDMKETAWALVTDERDRTGFVRRKDWTEALRREIDDLRDE